MSAPKKIVVCGAGVAGIATAYYLTKYLPKVEIILIDKNQPLSFTSSKSGENFRDYWPHPCMEALSSRSIDLMKLLKEDYGEEAFSMEFSGYHFVSHDDKTPIFADDNSPKFRKKNEVITNPEIIQKNHPYLDRAIKKSVFIKKAGNVDSITMANLMLKVAKSKGLKFCEGEIIDIKKTTDFTILLKSNQTIKTDQLIIATGPFINHLANMLDIAFPVWNTLQRKFIIPDPKGVIPSDMPFTIYADSQYLDWSAEESELLKTNEALKWMTEKFPGAIHIKPEPGGRIKMGWAFSTQKVNPQWTITPFEYFPQVVLKGASRFIPNLNAYAEQIPTPVIEYGGYYTRTKENWPLVGETEIANAYVVGALAGFGSMTACAVGELCALHLAEKELPNYASYFHPNRQANAFIQKEIAGLDMDGQL